LQVGGRISREDPRGRKKIEKGTDKALGIFGGKKKTTDLPYRENYRERFGRRKLAEKLNQLHQESILERSKAGGISTSLSEKEGGSGRRNKRII